ncbi:hypothetical protein [Macrococcus animalis]|uniref:hypothetical protein n=1 Tax=Macrococcus animalis TaxID=3395467 RepID=UPI0039BFF7B4
MIKIAILHEGKAYMPEIDAYASYLNDSGEFIVDVVSKSNQITDEYDIVWKVMGLDRNRSEKQALIHEYNTITVGKNAKVKDFLKKLLNTKPDGRIFQNKKVHQVFNFKDNQPFIYRDMGISKQYFIQGDVKKEYDFVYIGTMDPSRELNKMLEMFKKNSDLSIILIGTPDPGLEKEFGNLPNVHFVGRVPYEELPLTAAKARFGMNYIPDVFPFNKQTSTKLLEYCALNLNVVTTSYEWVNNFESVNNGKFFKLNSDLSNLTREELEAFNFVTPDLSHLEWNNLLKEAELIPFIKAVLENHKRKQK